MKRLFLSLVILVVALQMNATNIQYSSPDGKLRVNVSDVQGLHFNVSDGEKILIRQANIGMEIQASGKTIDLSQAKIKSKSSATYSSNTVYARLYRQVNYDSRYNQATLKLDCGANLEFRIYDEGIAYRFVTTGISGDYIVQDEKIDLCFEEDYKIHLPFSTNEKKPEAMAFQATYTSAPISHQESKLAFLPATVDAETVKITLMESDLESYPGMFVKASGIHVRATFAKYPKTTDYYAWRQQEYVTSTEDFIAKGSGNRSFPWRILAISRQDIDMPMNNMVYDLASLNRIGNHDWIRPGKVAWDWWNDWGISGVDFKAGINNETYKYYIDFASKYGLEYIILDEGWYKPSSGDLMTTIPEINLEELIAYAKQKNVHIILWCVFNCLDSNLEAICEKYSKMGIAGFKVDFLDRNDQKAVEMVYRIAETCAKYHLILDYHGIYAPTGINRTYPNIVNFEAVFGMEEVKWTNKSAQELLYYDVTFPYIRMQSGFVDYTPGGFRNATDKDFHPVNNNPMTAGTRCHQMAHYIIHESPLTMLADNPTIYMKEHECTQFIASLPSSFQSMKILDGKMCDYIVTLRTDKDGNFYVAGETNWLPRDIELHLNQFLDKGQFEVEGFLDGINADHVATDYKVLKTQITESSVLNIHMASGGGGFVLKIKKL